MARPINPSGAARNSVFWSAGGKDVVVLIHAGPGPVQNTLESVYVFVCVCGCVSVLI